VGAVKDNDSFDFCILGRKLIILEVPKRWRALVVRRLLEHVIKDTVSLKNSFR
jgi:hypothetical protein